MTGCVLGALAFLFILSVSLIVSRTRRWSEHAASIEDGRSTKPADTRPPPEPMEGWGYLAIVGESQYQSALRRIAKADGRLAWATLVPEPSNPFDSNAVMVQIGGETVGYFSRADARKYQRRLLALPSPLQVPAKLIGGSSGKASFGVLLDHREVERLPAPKRTRKPPLAPPADDQPF